MRDCGRVCVDVRVSVLVAIGRVFYFRVASEKKAEVLSIVARNNMMRGEQRRNVEGRRRPGGGGPTGVRILGEGSFDDASGLGGASERCRVVFVPLGPSNERHLELGDLTHGRNPPDPEYQSETPKAARAATARSGGRGACDVV